MYVREKGCEDPWLIFEVKKGPRANMLLIQCRDSKIHIMTNLLREYVTEFM